MSSGEASDIARDSEFEEDADDLELWALDATGGRSGPRAAELRDMGFGAEAADAAVARTLFVDEDDWLSAALQLLAWERFRAQGRYEGELLEIAEARFGYHDPGRGGCFDSEGARAWVEQRARATLRGPVQVVWRHLGEHLYLALPDLVRASRPKLKGSIGEGPNHSNFSDESSVNIVSEFRKFC